jgi:YD repeat-containing protein
LSWVGSSSTGSGCSSCTVRGTISKTLDSVGNTLSITDELSHVTSFTYDAANNLAADRRTSVTDAANNITHYAYDSENNLLSITDANNHTTSFKKRKDRAS